MRHSHRCLTRIIGGYFCYSKLSSENMTGTGKTCEQANAGATPSTESSPQQTNVGDIVNTESPHEQTNMGDIADTGGSHQQADDIAADIESPHEQANMGDIASGGNPRQRANARRPNARGTGQQADVGPDQVVNSNRSDLIPDELFRAWYHIDTGAFSSGEFGQLLNNMLVQYSAGKQPTRQAWYRNLATMKKSQRAPTIEQMEMVRTMNQGQVPAVLDEVFSRTSHGQKWIDARGEPVTRPCVRRAQPGPKRVTKPRAKGKQKRNLVLGSIKGLF